MGTTYYIVARSGDTWDDKTMHADRDCPDGYARPIDSDVFGDAAIDYCPECADGAGTCTVVKNDGEVCGRPTPCQYHD